MDLVRASPGVQGAAPPTPNEGGPDHGDHETVYVETAEDLASVAVGPGGQGGPPGAGPLHLTTITVAVPAPLSPSDVLQPHVVTTGAGVPQVTLPTVPAPQETAVRWKYEQNKPDKNISTHQTGSSLVSFLILTAN